MGIFGRRLGQNGARRVSAGWSSQAVAGSRSPVRHRHSSEDQSTSALTYSLPYPVLVLNPCVLLPTPFMSQGRVNKVVENHVSMLKTNSRKQTVKEKQLCAYQKSCYPHLETTSVSGAQHDDDGSIANHTNSETPWCPLSQLPERRAMPPHETSEPWNPSTSQSPTAQPQWESCKP